MKLLPEYVYKYGAEYKQIERNEFAAIYMMTKDRDGNTYPNFEVVLIRIAEPVIQFGKQLPLRELYPRSSEWGTWGFTFKSLSDAKRKMLELKARSTKNKHKKKKTYTL